ncbi:MAG: hypothetical protein KC897_08310 [Candidatus Omnitrophica bacterium]|nr:hypothetical protein [Candidatus Omnitrophota bacterium]MCB9721620.1 hypothetical protein [Candidatus Omnitrophota bacterium]
MKTRLCLLVMTTLLVTALPVAATTPMLTENDKTELDQLRREVIDLRVEKEVLLKKLDEIQTLMSLPDPANPGPAFNDRVAQEVLDKMARATRRFARRNNGIYPEHMNQLTDVFPPYIKDNYCNKIYSGFHYNCHMSEDGFKFVATPLTVGQTGSKVFAITTGGPFFDR